MALRSPGGMTPWGGALSTQGAEASRKSFLKEEDTALYRTGVTAELT